MTSRFDHRIFGLVVLALTGMDGSAVAQRTPVPQGDSIRFVSRRFVKDSALPPQVSGEPIKVDPAMRATWDNLIRMHEARREGGAEKDAMPGLAPFMPPPLAREIGLGTPAREAVPAPEYRGAPPDFDIQSAAAIGASFQGLPDDGARIPPDTNGAVGPAHVMAMLNSQVRIQDKSGIGAIPDVSLATFWAGTGAVSPFDPKLVYDQGSGRWLATADSEARSPASAVLFAISDTQDPTGAWTFYSIDADPTNVDWADFPDIGFNNTWIVITNNMFTVAADAFSGTAMWVIDRSTALAGGALTITQFAAGFDAAGVPADGGAFTSFALRPAKTFGAEPTLHLVSNPFLTSFGNNLLRISQVTGTAAAPLWSVVPGSAFLDSGLFVVATNFGFSQIDAAQLGTAVRIATNDSRMLDATFRNGRIWCTHSGGLPAVGFAGRTAVFWYQLDPAQMAATGDPIVQSGVIDGGFDVHYFFPSIAVNANDDMCLGFTRSDPTRFAEAVTAGRIASDPPGATDPITVIKSGEDSYVKDFGSGSVRWGDYSATVVDPSDDTSFWTVQEYAALEVGPNPNDDRWATWWASKTTPPTGDLLLTVQPGSESVQEGDPVIVTLDVANLSTAINGVTALIHYDTSLLQLESVVPRDLGLTPPASGWLEVSISDVAGDLAFAAGIAGGSTIDNGEVATLTFTALAGGVTNLSFLPDNPPAHPSLANVLTRADTGLLISPVVTPSGLITIGPCDDGLACTTDTFDPVNLVCVFTPNPAFCAITGICFADGAFNPVSDCQVCDVAMNQVDWTALAPGTFCGPAPDLCEQQDTCDGAGTCIDNGLAPVGTVCRVDAGQCDLPETCDGVNLACPLDAFEAPGTPCELDANPCTVDLCDGGGACLLDSDTSGIDVTIEIESLSPATTVVRNVTFVITNCLGIAETRNVPVTFDSLGIGQTLLAGVDTGASWVSATEGHTLRKLLPLFFTDPNGCAATVSFTGLDKLKSGDFSNAFVPQDMLVDIQDFAILSIEWNQPVDPNLGSLADATGNGIQDVGDFVSIQAHFAETGDAVDQCVAAAAVVGSTGAREAPMGHSETTQLAPRLAMSPDEIAIEGASRADVNGDGVIDVSDIRALAALRELRLTPAFQAKLSRLQAVDSGAPSKAASSDGPSGPASQIKQGRSDSGKQGFKR